MVTQHAHHKVGCDHEASCAGRAAAWPVRVVPVLWQGACCTACEGWRRAFQFRFVQLPSELPCQEHYLQTTRCSTARHLPLLCVLLCVLLRVRVPHPIERLLNAPPPSCFRPSLKVQRLLACCQARRLEFLAFDFRGHGGSSGRFLQHGPGDWLRDAAELLRRVVVARRVVLVGERREWRLEIGEKLGGSSKALPGDRSYCAVHAVAYVGPWLPGMWISTHVFCQGGLEALSLCSMPSWGAFRVTGACRHAAVQAAPAATWPAHCKALSHSPPPRRRQLSGWVVGAAAAAGPAAGCTAEHAPGPRPHPGGRAVLPPAPSRGHGPRWAAPRRPLAPG